MSFLCVDVNNWTSLHPCLCSPGLLTRAIWSGTKTTRPEVVYVPWQFERSAFGRAPNVWAMADELRRGCGRGRGLLPITCCCQQPGLACVLSMCARAGMVPIVETFSASQPAEFYRDALAPDRYPTQSVKVHRRFMRWNNLTQDLKRIFDRLQCLKHGFYPHPCDARAVSCNTRTRIQLA